MDNLGNSNPPGNDDIDKPIPFDDGSDDKPISLGDNAAGGSPGVSRAPLNLGGGGQASTPAPKPTPAPRPQASRPVAKKPTATAGPSRRIAGCKTFFTKLHPGAIEFLDDQITSWLKENPDVCIRLTNTTTGEVQAKKTEPNILITVWY